MVVAAVKVLATGLIWVSKGNEMMEESESDQVDEEAIVDSGVLGENELYERRDHRRTSVFGSFSKQKARDEQTVAM